MARILNIISQLIHLSKKAKKELEKGKYSSTKRIFKIILKIEKKELEYIQDEAGSQDFYNECLSIYKNTKKASHDLSTNKDKEAIKILDRIIALEKYELENITKATKGLEKEILDTVDPYIKELIQNINKLSFVKKTHYSCSGHFPHEIKSAYLIIEYDWNSKTKHNIKPFHEELLFIAKYAGYITKGNAKSYGGSLVRRYRDVLGIKKVNYYLGFPIKIPTKRSQEQYKQQLIKQWNKIYRLTKKYQDNDALEFKRERQYIKEHPSILGNPEKFIKQGIIIVCPKCGFSTMSKELTPTCKNCEYKFGSIIS